ncbi:hypothetical protein PG985_014792, partial [Apiospora marii]|uniref:uncharacterized protein n=1 Tax=Apiospora marii TaxID=335849 RepID=UPI00312FA917
MERDITTPIAVIGMSFQLPGGAASPDTLWSMMLEKRCASSDFPDDRLGGAALHHPDQSRGDSVPLKGGHFVDQELGAFDAPFFSISALEAEAMDPMSRALLETTYRALENAGESMEAISGSKTSVYTGNLADDYKFVFGQDIEQNSKYGTVGMTGLLSGRLSWFFNLRGPALTVDTACSSSLVALDLGCQSLLASTSDMAIVTGCSLLFAPNFFHLLSNMGMLSPNSKCFSFDHRANGYGRGEGIAALILKRLPDALRDNDTIRAVIRSTGVNYDGRTPGVTQPNGASQLSLIQETYKKAGLSMLPTRYLEAHGTGTPVGDVIETAAIGAAFQESRSLDDPLYIGSVKSNIGHAEGASGLASVIKAILTLENGLIPPNANFEILNPNIAADQLKIKVAEHATHWPAVGLRRASVNSFGASGTNAHAILDDALHYLRQRSLIGHHCTREVPALAAASSLNDITPTQTPPPDSPDGSSHQVGYADLPRLIILTAFDKPALGRVLNLHSLWMEKNKSAVHAYPEFLRDLAYTLLERRSLLRYRTFAVIDKQDAIQSGGYFPPAVRSMTKPRTAFVFTGQGAQWAGMGRDMFQFPVFYDTIREADAYLREIGVGWDLIDLLSSTNHKSSLDHPVLSQTLCTVIQLALCDLYRALQIQPSVVVGHSSGEIAAAYCTGAISRETAIRLAYFRGVQAAETSQKLSGGMMAVAMAASDMAPLLESVATPHHSLTLACINSPASVTISGDTGQLEELAKLLDKRQVFHRRLRVNVAYHSPIMGMVSMAYQRDIGKLTPGAIGTATKTEAGPVMISSVTGQTVDAATLRQAEYWAQNIMQPVLFSDAISYIWSSNIMANNDSPESMSKSTAIDVLVEIGPHSALESPIREILQTHSTAAGASYYSSMKRHVPSLRHFLTTLGYLSCQGVNINFAPVNAIGISHNHNRLGKVVETLPEYPFDHSCTYLPTGRLGRCFRFRRHGKLDLLGKPVVDWNPLQPRWRNFLKLSELPWVKDHKINDTVIYPAVGVLVMAIEAANQLADPARTVKGFKLTNTYFKKPRWFSIFLPGAPSRTARLGDSSSFPYDGTQWQEHSYGIVHIDYARRPNSLEGSEDMERLQHARGIYNAVSQSAVLKRTKGEFYDSAFKSGYTFGPAFRAMDDVTYSDRPSRHATASINCYDWKDDDGRNHFQEHVVHPVTLDGILQASIAAFSRAGEDVTSTAVPAEIEYIWVSRDGLSRPGTDMVRSVGTFIHRGNVGYETSVIALDSSLSRVTLDAKGIKTRFVTGVAPAQDPSRHHHLCYGIEWRPDIDMLRLTTHRLATIVQTQEVECEGSLGGADRLLVDFLGLLAFKKPNMRILHVADPDRDFRADPILRGLFHSQQGGTGPVLPCSEFSHSSSALQVGDKDSYDLVIDTCGYMPEALDNTHRILEPGGKLALLVGPSPLHKETENVNGYYTDDSAFHQLSSTHKKEQSPEIRESSCKQLQHALEQAGFIDVLLSFTDTTSPSLLVTASKPRKAVLSRTRINFILVIEATPFQEELARILSVNLGRVALMCTTCYLDQLTMAGEEDPPRVLVFLSELERPLLASLSREVFPKLRDALISTKGLLWLTGRDEGGLFPPYSGMADGLTRVLRSENGHAVIVTAALANASVPDHALQIFSLIQATDFGTTNQDYETSYLQVDGNLHIGRLRPMANFSQIISSKSSPYQARSLPIREAPPLRLKIETPGLIDSLYFDHDLSAEEPLAPGWVEIRVVAVGLNFKDLLLALGRENGTTFGNECAGVVRRTGSNTPFQIGDRVCVFSSTAFSTYTRARAENIARVPDDVSLAHAAAVPVQFVTAWHAIHNAARMQKGESILIHSAAGGTGQAALQIAQLLGCDIFATVGSEDKKRFLISRYGICEDHIFYSRNVAFAQGILRLTNGRGVDVIINSLSGDELFASWDIIAPHGRFIELGKKDIAANSGLPMRPFLRRATFAALEIGDTAADFGILGKDIIDHVLGMFSQGTLRPVEYFEVLPISRLTEGMRALQSGQSMGKIVFDMEDDASVPVRIRSQSAWRLDGSKTYVIAGGTGGLGMMIAEWMVKHKGARHLLLLSRSGIKHGAIDIACNVKGLRGFGAVIEAPECDITNIDALRGVIEKYRCSMPPIAGCIQASMVLKDTVFANMSYGDWLASTDPKVRGSWNLHTVLPDGLDFFILLSSIAGVVGSAGQANYAAGNAYMDALAHYRNALGERAVALDVGAMLDRGFLAKNETLRDRILSAGLLRGISSSELLNLLDHLCDPASSVPRQQTTQVTIGLSPAPELRTACRQSRSPLLSLPFYQHIFIGAAKSNEQANGDDSPEAQRRRDFVSAKSLPGAGIIVSQALLQRLVAMTPGLRDRIDTKHLDEPIQTFGVDSLQAIELRSWFAQEFAADVPIFVILGEETLASIGLLVARKSRLRTSEGVNEI